MSTDKLRRKRIFIRAMLRIDEPLKSCSESVSIADGRHSIARDSMWGACDEGAKEFDWLIV